MAHFMFCVSGYSGTGKDEFCKCLVDKYGAVHTGLADPAKRHMADVYGFTKHQLFGPSEARNSGDPRYPKTRLIHLGGRPADAAELLPTSTKSPPYPRLGWWLFDVTPQSASEAGLKYVARGDNSAVLAGDRHLPTQYLGRMQTRVFVQDTDPGFFLSPREALQLYCDLMNQLDMFTWVRAGVSTHRKLAELHVQARGTRMRSPKYAYDRMLGLCINKRGEEWERGLTEDVVTCFSDFRHRHEIQYVRQAEKTHEDFKPVLIRVKRPGVETPPFNHRSETEQATIPDSEFDYVVDNNDTIESLHKVAAQIVEQVKGVSK